MIGLDAILKHAWALSPPRSPISLTAGVRSNDGHINVPFNILFTINQSKCLAVAAFDTIIAPHIQELMTGDFIRSILGPVRSDGAG